MVAQHQQVALVLSDLIMPEMGGQELRLRIQKLYPHIKLIFMTGYALDADPSFGSLGLKTDWIQKPFTIAALAIQVQAALNT